MFVDFLRKNKDFRGFLLNQNGNTDPKASQLIDLNVIRERSSTWCVKVEKTTFLSSFVSLYRRLFTL